MLYKGLPDLEFGIADVGDREGQVTSRALGHRAEVERRRLDQDVGKRAVRGLATDRELGARGQRQDREERSMARHRASIDKKLSRTIPQILA